jgi:hypothetical protein
MQNLLSLPPIGPYWVDIDGRIFQQKYLKISGLPDKPLHMKAMLQ